jgi:hypothetical protein
LIDANALKIAFKCREMADIDMYGGCHIAECFQGYEANEIVDKMPTVDAVEVVRCKDCIHRGDSEECPMRYFETDRYSDVDGDVILDYIDHDYTKDDGFCDRGERKDNDLRGA